MTTTRRHDRRATYAAVTHDSTETGIVEIHHGSFRGCQVALARHYLTVGETDAATAVLNFDRSTPNAGPNWEAFTDATACQITAVS